MGYNLNIRPNAKSGDVIIALSRLEMWEEWGDPNKKSISALQKDDLAFVIEDLTGVGGNGVKVFTSDGKIGWINIYFVKRVE